MKGVRHDTKAAFFSDSTDDAPLRRPGRGYCQAGRTLADIFRRYHTTGAVVAVGKGEELVYHFDYGWADKKS